MISIDEMLDKIRSHLPDDIKVEEILWHTQNPVVYKVRIELFNTMSYYGYAFDVIEIDDLNKCVWLGYNGMWKFFAYTSFVADEPSRK